uniref:C2 domain-containing protein n=1 Tax=Caenorhabditis japonica TaxID=281687 RepID=A0A8R1HHN8_CAEJA
MEEMLTLIVSVKKARLQSGVDEFNSYVTVKLQNVKSTTVAVRGNLPCWEQEFIFETNRPDDGMVLELWAKGVLWDKLIGVHYMSLSEIKYSNAVGSGQWLQMDHELETRNGQTVGTRGPTGHNLLADVRFELPFASSFCGVLGANKYFLCKAVSTQRSGAKKHKKKTKKRKKKKKQTAQKKGEGEGG